MSVVHQLSPGWLLDHLSFINKINYHLHQQHKPCCSKNEPTFVHFDSLQMDSVSSFGTSATFIASDSTTKPDNDAGGNCEMFVQKYVFRPELFDVTKPYITPAIHKECQQRNEKEDLMNDVKKENFISTIGKVGSFKKFLFFYRTQKEFIIPISQISCDLLSIKSNQ